MRSRHEQHTCHVRGISACYQGGVWGIQEHKHTHTRALLADTADHLRSGLSLKDSPCVCSHVILVQLGTDAFLAWCPDTAYRMLHCLAGARVLARKPEHQCS